MTGWLWRWSDRRMYADLRDQYLRAALYSWWNITNTDRPELWSEEHARYMDRAWGYEMQRRAA